MHFEYFAGHQRTPDWYRLRLGKITASRLVDWLAVSKAKGTAGKPLKARLDYETELIYERTFNVSFNNYVTEAMQDGIDLERFAVAQYEKIRDVKVQEVGAWFNDTFVASPDGIVDLSPGIDAINHPDAGIIEVKVVRDASFTDILVNGVPDKYWKQVQGQLFATGKNWCDFIAINTNTKKVKIIRVLPDPEFFEYLELALQEQLTAAEFDKTDLFDFVDELPDNYVESGDDTPKGKSW